MLSRIFGINVVMTIIVPNSISSGINDVNDTGMFKSLFVAFLISF